MRAVAFIALCLAAPASGALVRVDLEARAPVAAEQARDGLALVAQCVAPDCVLEVKRLAPARVRASFRVADGAVDALATAITAAPQSLFRLALGSELVAPPAISLEHPRPSCHHCTRRLVLCDPSPLVEINRDHFRRSVLHPPCPRSQS